MADLTIRDWMVIIGVLLITAVLLDAWRRVRNERRSGVRLKLQPAGEEPATGKPDDISWLKELPNGGARVVRRGDLARAMREAAAPEAAAPAKPAVARRAPPAERPAVRRDAAPAVQPEPELEPEPEPEAGTAELDAPPTAEPEREPAPEPRPRRSMPAIDDFDDDPVDDLFAGMSAERDDVFTPAMGSALPEDDSPAPPADDPGTLPRSPESEVFMLNVVARDPRGFRGEDILHILLACDLRFGDMNFFHRHEFEAGKGAIQFSVANMMQPGVFDIDNMGDFTTPGLVFFVTLPGPEDMMKAFDYMLETAQAVARNLGGDVLDESRSVLTRQALEHSRQQIRDLERRLLARAR